MDEVCSVPFLVNKSHHGFAAKTRLSLSLSRQGNARLWKGAHRQCAQSQPVGKPGPCQGALGCPRELGEWRAGNQGRARRAGPGAPAPSVCAGTKSRLGEGQSPC